MTSRISCCVTAYCSTFGFSVSTVVRVLLDVTALPLFNYATFDGLLGGFFALLTLICIYEPYRDIGCLSSTVGALSLRLVPK